MSKSQLLQSGMSTPRAPAAIDTADGRSRAVVDAVLPVVDGGRFAVKRVAGETVRITAHVFTDGHDAPRVMLQWWKDGDANRHELAMKLRYNDEWLADFVPPTIGLYHYTVVAWVDAFESWRHELERRVDADDIRLAARVGAIEIAAAAERASGSDHDNLAGWAQALEAGAADPTMEIAALKALALDEDLGATAGRHPDRSLETRFAAELPLTVDRERAACSSWYELFPNPAGTAPSRTSRPACR
jgi:starch synthase (maltosyl-transferring)